jgi:hypothetical protein
MNQETFWSQFIKVSTIAQFAAAKVSVVISATTLATVLSMKFNLDWFLAIATVASIGAIAIFVVYASGWVRKEATYGQQLSNIHPKLEEISNQIKEMNERMDKAGMSK